MRRLCLAGGDPRLLALGCDSGRGRAGRRRRALQREAVAKDARLAGDRARTRFIADLSKKVDVHVFALADPYRVIVDLPEVSFQMPAGLGTEKRGLVSAFRYGLFAPGKSRIVIDMNGPFLMDKAFVLERSDDQPARLVVDLVATDRKDLPRQAAADTIACRWRSITQPPPRAVDARPRRKPVVVLDPGHGGIDPGTASAAGITEKEVVLAFAKTLRQKLEAKGDYQVYLTREDDTFLAAARARRVRARQGAQSVRLDPRRLVSQDRSQAEARAPRSTPCRSEASDDEAKELAAKENFSDALAGVDLPSDRDEVVANILIDLAQRETQNRSIIFAKSVVGEHRAVRPASEVAQIGRISRAEIAGRALGAARAWLLEQSRRREAAHL